MLGKCVLFLGGMAATATGTILAVLLLRLVLRRFPRIFSYVLWMAVMIRLVCPVLPDLGFGLFSDGMDAYHMTKAWSGEQGFVGVDPADGLQVGGSAVEGSDGSDAQNAAAAAEQEKTGSGEASADWIVNLCGILWLCGALLVLSWGIGTYALFLRRLDRTVLRSAPYRTGAESRPKGETSIPVFFSEQIQSPFTAGILHPVIYLPEGLEDAARELICEHERVHIRRRDMLVKMLSWGLVSLYWFHPLVWLSYFLMERDMEVSCDEAVLKKMGEGSRKAYARTLLLISQNHSGLAYTPVAFGEKGVKERIRNAVKWKKPRRRALIAAGGLVALVGILLVSSGAEASWGSRLRSDGPMETQSETRSEVQPETELEVQSETGSESEVQPETQPEARSEEAPEAAKSIRQEITDPARYGADLLDADAALLVQEESAGTGETEISWLVPVADARISDDFGVRVHPVTQKKLLHSGTDYAAPEGTQVMASAEGSVYRTGFDADSGYYIILRHADGSYTYYAHCKEILAEEGQQVEQGSVIATVGSTGKSTGAHLHFARSRDGMFVEPLS